MSVMDGTVGVASPCIDMATPLRCACWRRDRRGILFLALAWCRGRTQGVLLGFSESLPDIFHFYWVFYGGLTSAATRITVTQMTTGLEDEWINPARKLPQSVGPTQASPCG